MKQKQLEFDFMKDNPRKYENLYGVIGGLLPTLMITIPLGGMLLALHNPCSNNYLNEHPTIFKTYQAITSIPVIASPYLAGYFCTIGEKIGRKRDSKLLNKLK